MSRLDIIASAADEFSQEVSKLLAVGSFPPVWKANFGWRYPDRMEDAGLLALFWLTKLAGIASTVHASTLLARQGYWFQVGILSRSVTEAHLSIAYTLPKPNMQTGNWPNEKQHEAIREHFKETWTDPHKLFSDQRQRKHIRELSAAIGHMQDGNSVLTQHDASQVALQNMRILSDYTHMAYPQVMELFSEKGSFALAGNQRGQPLFGEMELGRLIVSSFIHAGVVCELLRKMYAGCAEIAESEQAERKEAAMIHEKLQAVTTLRDWFEAAAIKLERVFPSSDEEARKVLRAFKQGKPVG